MHDLSLSFMFLSIVHLFYLVFYTEKKNIAICIISKMFFSVVQIQLNRLENVMNIQTSFINTSTLTHYEIKSNGTILLNTWVF